MVTYFLSQYDKWDMNYKVKFQTVLLQHEMPYHKGPKSQQFEILFVSRPSNIGYGPLYIGTLLYII